MTDLRPWLLQVVRHWRVRHAECRVESREVEALHFAGVEFVRSEKDATVELHLDLESAIEADDADLVAADLLEESGFLVQAKLLRMMHGGPPPCGD